MFRRRSKTPTAAEAAAAVEARAWKSGRVLSPADEKAAEARSDDYYARVHELRALCPQADHSRCHSH